MVNQKRLIILEKRLNIEKTTELQVNYLLLVRKKINIEEKKLNFNRKLIIKKG